MAAAREQFFVTCAPGIEPVLHEELRALKLAKVERQVGGCYFEGTLRDAMRVNLWLRTAVRVLMRVARFRAADADELYAGAREVDWSRFVAANGTLVVDAHSSQSALDHTLFVAQRVKDAIADSFREASGARPSVVKDGADLGVYAHLSRDRCTLLVDTSGETLHKRGWRRFQGRAPLAETLAAAIVMLSEWDQRAPLLDPFCGSGTILIEAALMARNVAPGSFRERFGFERWREHDAPTWRRLRAEARASQRETPKLVLAGFDRDAKTLDGARENARAAGVLDGIRFERADALDFAPRPGWNAWVVTNPPYGERIGGERELLRRFGELLRERCAGYRVAVLGPRDEIERALGFDESRTVAVENGGIPCDLVLAEA
jgi:23S rRNA G2445 N2-methylase RlmL